MPISAKAAVTSVFDGPTAEILYEYPTDFGTLQTWEDATDDYTLSAVTTTDASSTGNTLNVTSTTPFEAGGHDCVFTESCIMVDGQLLTITGITTGVSLTVSDIIGTISSEENVAAGFGLRIDDVSEPYDDLVYLLGSTNTSDYWRRIFADDDSIGVRFTCSTAGYGSKVIQIGEDYCKVQGIEAGYSTLVSVQSAFYIDASCPNAEFVSCSMGALTIVGFLMNSGSCSHCFGNSSGYVFYTAAGTVNYYNCTGIAVNSSTSFYWVGGTPNLYNCISSIAFDAHNNLYNCRVSETDGTGGVMFEDADNDDFSLSDFDTWARNRGIDLSTTVQAIDINGNARDDGDWDIGAYESDFAPIDPKFGLGDNLIVYDELISIAEWTDNSTGGSVAIEFNPSGVTGLIDVAHLTAGSSTYTEIEMEFTPDVGENWIVKSDIVYDYGAGPTDGAMVQILDASDDSMLVELLLGDTADQVDFTTDLNSTPATSAWTAGITKGRMIRLYYDDSDETITFFLSGDPSGLGSPTKVGTKDVTPATSYKIVYTALSGSVDNEIWIDHFVAFYPQFAAIGASYTQGQLVWWTYPYSGRVNRLGGFLGKFSTRFDNMWIDNWAWGGSQGNHIQTASYGTLDMLLETEPTKVFIQYDANAIIDNLGPSVADMMTDFDENLATIQAAGITESNVICGNTMALAWITGSMITERDTYNAHVLAEQPTENFLLFDTYSIFVDPADADQTNPLYEASDGIHLNEVGSAAGGEYLFYLFQEYSFGTGNTLPSNDSPLTTAYSPTEFTIVSTSNNTRVSVSATSDYALHQYKDSLALTGGQAELTWEGQSTVAPSTATIYLQVYDQDADTWGTVDSDSSTGADTDFTLEYTVTDTTDFKSVNSLISCRVYQFGTVTVGADYWNMTESAAAATGHGMGMVFNY